jgi:hypothetical protein
MAIADKIIVYLALLNKSMNCPHPQPFSLGIREPDLLISPLDEG